MPEKSCRLGTAFRGQVRHCGRSGRAINARIGQEHEIVNCLLLTVYVDPFPVVCVRDEGGRVAGRHVCVGPISALRQPTIAEMAGTIRICWLVRRLQRSLRLSQRWGCSALFRPDCYRTMARAVASAGDTSRRLCS